jgi:hypothetical protein
MPSALLVRKFSSNQTLISYVNSSIKLNLNHRISIPAYALEQQ